jgi:transcriptional regulator with XRE-family HTH domain
MRKEKREMPRTFGQKLKYYRQLRGYSCKDLARLADIDAGYVNKMEKGVRRAPSYPILRNLAEALQVSVTDLIDIELPEKEPVRSIQEVLVSTEYLINGKLPSMEIRENLLAVIQTILDCEWTQNTKHTDTVKIMDKVNQFLNSLKH